MSGPRYDAFISYSRGASQRLAIALQSAIERFATPWYRSRSSRVFRDDANMSANAGLWSTIEAGLAGSAWYVLVATPEAAASPWVRKELAWWVQHRGTERLLIVRHAGELVWDAAAGDVDWSATTALPRELAGAFREEPRWVDLAWFGDGTGAGAGPGPRAGLGTDDPRWTERVADLASAIRSVERDELVGENVRARRRARTALAGGVSALAALLVASLVATGIAIVQGNEARTQASIALARQLAAQSRSLAASDIQLASLLAVEAVRTHEDEHTLAALFEIATASPYLVRIDTAPAAVTAVATSADGGTLVVGTAEGEVLVGPGAADRGGGGLRPIGALDGVTDVAVDASGAVVAASWAGTESRPGSAVVWVDGVEQRLPVDVGDAIEVSADGTAIAVFGSDRTIGFRRDGADGFARSFSFVGGAPVMSFSPEGELVAAARTGSWWRVPLADPAAIVTGELFVPMSSQGTALSGDGRLLLTTDGSAVFPVVPLEPGSSIETPPLQAASPVSGPLAVALSDSGALAAVNVDHVLSVVPVVAPTEPVSPTLSLTGGGAASPDVLDMAGERFIVSGSGQRVLVWDLGQSSRITAAFPAVVPEDCRACMPPGIAVSPDGTTAVAWTATGGPLVRYDLTTGASDPIDGAFQTPVWLPDGSLAAYSILDDAVVFLDEHGRETGRAPAGIGAAGTLAAAPAGDGVGLLSAEGEWIVVGAGGVSARVRTAVADLVESGLAPIWAAVGPDGASAAVTAQDDDGVLIGLLVATADGAEVMRGALEAIAYRADGDAVIVAGGVARVLDVAARELVGDAVSVAVDPLPSPFVSPDGAILANAGLDGRLELFDLRRWGALLGSIATPDEENAWAFSAFTPDGTRLVTAVQAMAANGWEGSLRVTDLDPAAWAAAACAVAGRDLTEAEWRRYLPGDPPADRGCLRGEVALSGEAGS